MKVITVIGARPQFIKAATVSRAFSEYGEVEEIIVHTGQHYDSNMSQIFFDDLQIPRPQYNLEINNVSHGRMTGRMLEKLDQVFDDHSPDMVLVYGDTNSTLAGALSAVKMHIPVAHVEAGLRSFNNSMPEEINRILTDRISKWLFCPTQTAMDNLINEGFQNFDSQVSLVGDVMYDAALFYAEKSDEKSTIIADLGISDFVLCTFHRQENTDDPKNLSEIIEALNEINKELQVVCPMHPRTQAKIDRKKCEFKIIEPVSYFDMISLLKRTQLVLTDSGGLQKEAFFFKKHCITLREETEWTELVDIGVNQIVGAERNRIIKGFEKVVGTDIGDQPFLYGEGNAAQLIAQQLVETKFAGV